MKKIFGHADKTPRQRHEMVFAFVMLNLLLLALLGRTALIRVFNPDEFQHLEMAWLIAQHHIPYKDFFEHHTPLYHFLIAPLLAGSDITTSGDAAVRIVLGLRLLAVIVCAGILALTGILARKTIGLSEALVATALLVGSALFVQVGIEIRPDQLATIGLLLSSLALVAFKDSRKIFWYLVVASLSATLAVLATQKALLAFPGLGVTFGVACVQRRLTAKEMISGVLILFGTAVVTLSPVLFYFWSHDALANFIEDNFLLVTRWVHHAYPMIYGFSLTCREDSLFVLLIGIGLSQCRNLKRAAAIWRLAVLAPMFSMLLAMPFFPVAQMQYVFLFLPYLAMLGGIGAAAIIESLPGHHKTASPLMILFIAIMLHGITLIANQGLQTNAVALDSLRYVVEQTPPDSTVLRGWSSGVAFRKPAYFYFSLHGEIHSIIPDASFAELADGLRRGSIAPDIVEMDEDMKTLPQPVIDILQAGWQPVGIGDLWRRKE